MGDLFGDLRGIRKAGTVYLVSREAYYTSLGYEDERYKRKVNIKTTEPTGEAWRRYGAAVKAMKVLEAYEGMEWGGPEYGPELREPEPTHEYEYLETEKEWLARCRELDQKSV